MSDLELAAVLTLGLLGYRIVEALMEVRRGDRNRKAERVRDTYGWPVEATRSHIPRSKSGALTGGQQLRSRPKPHYIAKVGCIE